MTTSLSVSDTTVTYTQSGQGPALVLVHGTSMDGASNFGHLVERFSDRRRVVCPNYGGTGGSSIPEGDLTLDVLTEQIAAVIRHASDGPVELLGDSLGAVVAAATAARHPELVRRLVLIAGWADSGDARHQLVFGSWARLEGLDSELGNRYGMSLALTPSFLTAFGRDTISKLLEQKTPPHTKQRIELGLRIDIRDEAKKISVPTLIIRGANDYLVPEYQTRPLHHLIAGSQYVAVESGHGVLLEKPDEVAALVRAFLFDGIAS